MKKMALKTVFARKIKKLGLSVKDFSVLTGTPYRTVQNWALGVSRTPGIAKAYVRMLEEKVKKEGLDNLKAKIEKKKKKKSIEKKKKKKA